MNRGAWQATVHEAAGSDMTERPALSLSAGLVWGLRLCISHQFPGDVMLLVQGPHSEPKSTRLDQNIRGNVTCKVVSPGEGETPHLPAASSLAMASWCLEQLSHETSGPLIKLAFAKGHLWNNIGPILASPTPRITHARGQSLAFTVPRVEQAVKCAGET